MPGVRPLAALLAVALLGAACADDGPTVTTIDPRSREAVAGDYAASALRALDGTAAEGMAASAVSALLLAACDRVDGGVPAAEAAVEVSATTPDPALLAEVVEVGIGLVCPDEPPTSLDLIVRYEASVNLALMAAGVGLPEDPVAVLQAGPVACDAFSTGGRAEQAFVGAAGTLFGVEAGTLDGLRALSEEEVLLLGAVVASATTILCPEHEAAMREFLEGLRPET